MIEMGKEDSVGIEEGVAFSAPDFLNSHTILFGQGDDVTLVGRAGNLQTVRRRLDKSGVGLRLATTKLMIEMGNV